MSWATQWIKSRAWCFSWNQCLCTLPGELELLNRCRGVSSQAREGHGRWMCKAPCFHRDSLRTKAWQSYLHPCQLGRQSSINEDCNGERKGRIDPRCACVLFCLEPVCPHPKSVFEATLVPVFPFWYSPDGLLDCRDGSRGDTALTLLWPCQPHSAPLLPQSHKIEKEIETISINWSYEMFVPCSFDLFTVEIGHLCSAGLITITQQYAIIS